MRKSPYVYMAMLAPGTAPSRGTADFKKTLMTFHAQVLGFSEQGAVVHEIDPEAFDYAEDPMPAGDFFQDVGQQPFAVFDDPLLVARGTKAAALARKRQEIFLAATVASDPGEAASQVAAVQVSINYVGGMPSSSFRVAGRLVPGFRVSAGSGNSIGTRLLGRLSPFSSGLHACPLRPE